MNNKLAILPNQVKEKFIIWLDEFIKLKKWKYLTWKQILNEMLKGQYYEPIPTKHSRKL